MKLIFLAISIALTLSSAVFYIRDILRGSTKPNLVSWITWTLLTAVATAAEISAGEYVVAVFTGIATLETLSIVILGIRHGFVRYSIFDVISQIGALIGFALWWLFNSPGLAVVAVVLIDLIGALPTVRHSWISPSEETWEAFGVAGASGLFAVLALSNFDWVTLPYPAYIMLINAIIAVTIIYRRRIVTA